MFVKRGFYQKKLLKWLVHEQGHHNSNCTENALPQILSSFLSFLTKQGYSRPCPWWVGRENGVGEMEKEEASRIGKKKRTKKTQATILLFNSGKSDDIVA